MIVLLSAIPMLGEKPSRSETILVAVGLFGVLLYFYSEIQIGFLGVSILGLLIGLASLLANSASALIGRAINRTLDTPPLVVTGIMMSVGSVFLMLLSLTIETMIPLSLTSWAYILWLAVVNTALAFTLWNRAMRVLRAVDMTLINSTMMPQIVILSIAFLGEFPGLLDWIGLILLAISVAAVQYIQTKRLSNSNERNKRKANVS